MDTVLDASYTPACVHELAPQIPGFVTVLRNVLTEAECANIIAIAEQTGFKAASLYTDVFGNEHFSNTRKSQRCIIDSRAFVDSLQKRIADYIPAEFNGLKFARLNERLRILKYLPGDEFKPHVDGSYSSSHDNTTSKLTLLIYLNQDYQDGYTCFSDGADGWIAVIPTTGGIAIQDQGLLHCVPPLKQGCKYAIRTEAMYTYPVSTSDVKIVQVRL